MKLRTRLALTLGGATVALLVLIGWAQSRWHRHVRVEVLAEAAVPKSMAEAFRKGNLYGESGAAKPR